MHCTFHLFKFSRKRWFMAHFLWVPSAQLESCSLCQSETRTTEAYYRVGPCTLCHFFSPLTGLKNMPSQISKRNPSWVAHMPFWDFSHIFNSKRHKCLCLATQHVGTGTMTCRLLRDVFVWNIFVFLEMFITLKSQKIPTIPTSESGKIEKLPIKKTKKHS